MSTRSRSLEVTSWLSPADKPSSSRCLTKLARSASVMSSSDSESGSGLCPVPAASVRAGKGVVRCTMSSSARGGGCGSVDMVGQPALVILRSTQEIKSHAKQTRPSKAARRSPRDVHSHPRKHVRLGQVDEAEEPLAVSPPEDTLGPAIYPSFKAGIKRVCVVWWFLYWTWLNLVSDIDAFKIWLRTVHQNAQQRFLDLRVLLFLSLFLLVAWGICMCCSVGRCVLRFLGAHDMVP